MMDAFCYCTIFRVAVSVALKVKKLHIDGIKPSWSLVFIVCYQVCFGMLSQRRVIGFPMLLSSGMWITTGWFPTEMRRVCLPLEMLSRVERRRCRNHSLPGNQEVAMTCGCGNWLLWMCEIKKGREREDTLQTEECTLINLTANKNPLKKGIIWMTLRLSNSISYFLHDRLCTRPRPIIAAWPSLMSYTTCAIVYT